MSRERTYPVPARVATPLLGDAATMGDIDLFIEAGYGDAAQREWAIGIRDKFVTQQINRVAPSGVLPRGLVDTIGDVDVVTTLVAGGRCWRGDWDGDLVKRFDDVIDLTTEEVAFAVDAIGSGHGLALLATTPVAVMGRALVAAPDDTPKGAKVVAIVDEVDRNAVLEMLAIAPGPIVFRRHDGRWERDDAWLRSLRGVKPPPVVSLATELVASVAAQVDEATRGKPFSAATASGYDARLFDMQVSWLLVAAAQNPITADVTSGRMPANLKKYWVFGKGAAKIRWGTPGAMRRCHRQLQKYVGPGQAWAVCNNISKLRGGKGVAWDVD